MTRPTIIPKLLLGALVVACLPRFPDGDRGTQCWTDRVIEQASCIRIASWCLEGSRDEDEASDCISALSRCELAARDTAIQCERHTGCLAALEACEHDCDFWLDGSSGCYAECQGELELCAPWLDLDCERRCDDAQLECLSSATFAFYEVACDRERTDCVLECYGRDPAEGGPAGTCEAGRFTCDDDRITACVDGNRVEAYECRDVCAVVGSEPTGCRNDDCQCLGQPGSTDACELGVSVFCLCAASFGVPCTPSDTTALLADCNGGASDIPFACYAQYASDVPGVCEVIVDICDCPWTNDGACDEPEGTGACAEGSDPGDC